MKPLFSVLFRQNKYVFSSRFDNFIKEKWGVIGKYTLVDPFRMGKLLDFNYSIWVSDVETSLFDTATIFGTLVNQVNYIKKIKRHTRYHFRFRNYKHFNFYHFIASKQHINSHANPYSYMRMQICKCNCLEDMLTYVQTSFHASTQSTAYFKS